MNINNYTVDQLSAALDILEHIGKSEHPHIECAKLSMDILDILDIVVERLSKVEVLYNG